MIWQESWSISMWYDSKFPRALSRLCPQNTHTRSGERCDLDGPIWRFPKEKLFKLVSQATVPSIVVEDCIALLSGLFVVLAPLRDEDFLYFLVESDDFFAFVVAQYVDAGGRGTS